MKKYFVVLSIVGALAIVQVAEANPLLMMGGKRVLKSVVAKNSKHVILQKLGKGRMILNNLKNGKVKNIKLQFDKMVKMPKGTSGSLSAKGFVRNSKMFWKKFKNSYPKALSNRNLLRLKRGKSPVVDRKWMKFFPEHKPFNGQKLEHHHLNKGAFSIPLPFKLHRGKINSKFFH